MSSQHVSEIMMTVYTIVINIKLEYKCMFRLFIGFNIRHYVSKTVIKFIWWLFNILIFAAHEGPCVV